MSISHSSVMELEENPKKFRLSITVQIDKFYRLSNEMDPCKYVCVCGACVRACVLAHCSIDIYIYIYAVLIGGVVFHV